MKKLVLSLLTLMAASFALPATAASTVQNCATNEECALVTNSCTDNCGFIPVNKANLAAAQTQYQAKCGKPMGSNQQCTVNPPLASACVNSRCTIDYAYANHAGAKDYQAGAYPVPEKAEASKVPAAPYASVNDKKGDFSAYNLPQGEVKQNTVGQIVDRVYVPPSAPVSGGNYIPVGSVPEAPINPPVTQTPPPAAIPATPQAAPNAAPQTYVPAPTQPTVPAPGLAPVPRSPTAQVAPAPVPSVGAPGVPQAPAGSTPIPPSDLKPAPTFVPPAGTAVPVSPEDPGAPPAEGVSMTVMPDGTMATVTKAAPEAAAKAKSFGGVAEKKSTSSLNQ